LEDLRRLNQLKDIPFQNDEEIPRCEKARKDKPQRQGKISKLKT